jgi:hypothetical protein
MTCVLDEIGDPAAGASGRLESGLGELVSTPVRSASIAVPFVVPQTEAP